MKKSMLQALVVTAILSGMNGVVSAGGGQDSSKLDEYTLDDVVVTAQRVETKDLDTPATTTVITAQQLKDTGATTTYEAIERVPGLNAFSYGQGGEAYGGMFSRINIRGLDRGTLMLIDGVPANMLNYNSFLNTIPVDSIEKIEIVKGAGSVLYGADAFGGVINIITKKPEGKKVQGSVSGTIGSYEKNYAVTVGNEDVTLTYQRDYRKPVHQIGRIYTTGTSRKARANGTKDYVFLNLRLSDKLTANYSYADTNSEYDTFKYDEGGTKDWTKPEYRYHWDLKTQRVGLTYDDSDRQWRTKFAWARQTIRPFAGNGTTNTDSNSYHFETQKAWDLRGGKDNLVSGLEFHSENVEDHTKTEATMRRDSYAAFLSYTRQFNDYFSATFGMREHFVKANSYEQRQNVFLPQIQTLYKISPKAVWYVNIGKSFEMPAVNSWFPAATRKVLKRQHEMKPQVGWNYETGLKFGDQKESVKLAVFRMMVKNKFVWIKDPSDPTISIQANQDEFRNVGMELEYNKQINPHLSARIGGYYANPQARDGQKWKQADARQQYFLGLQYRNAKLRVNTDWYITAKRQDAYYLMTGKTQTQAKRGPDHKVPNRIEGNLTMSYEMTPDQTVSFGVYNILNRENPINEYEYWSLPRNYRLSYTYQF